MASLQFIKGSAAFLASMLATSTPAPPSPPSAGAAQPDALKASQRWDNYNQLYADGQITFFGLIKDRITDPSAFVAGYTETLKRPTGLTFGDVNAFMVAGSNIVPGQAG